MEQVDASSKNDVRAETVVNLPQQARPSVSAAVEPLRPLVYLQAPEIMDLLSRQGSERSSPAAPAAPKCSKLQRPYREPAPISERIQRLRRRLSHAEPEGMGVIEVIATLASIVLLVFTLPFSLCFAFKVVQEYERAVIFRLGRLRTGGARGPGIFFVLPCVDTYCKVDLRTVSFDVAPQEVLTKDSVTVTVDAVIYYRVQEPLNAVVKVNNYSHSTRLLAATTLRNVLGTRNLSEILSDREAIAHMMQTALDDATDPWGVKVERVEIKDVRLPVQLQRAMAAEAEAAREARAKVIAAEGEMKASRALKEASDVMAESPAALQLRYLQTLNSISAEKNSTIIFPLPLDILTPFLRPTQSRHFQSGYPASEPLSPLPQ